MKKLLLHVCCAPCSSGVIEKLKEEFDVTVYFYNPNMDTPAEYTKRAEEVKRFMGLMNVNYVIEEFVPKQFFDAINGLENEPEGGARCEKCFLLRLTKTFEYACDHGFDCVSTTLSVSPYKNVKVINTIGLNLSKQFNIEFLDRDYKKKDGYLKSIQNSKKFNLYRQNYCGCVFSKRRDLNLKKNQND